MDGREILVSKHLLTRLISLIGLCVNETCLSLNQNFFYTPRVNIGKFLKVMYKYSHFVSIPCVGESFRQGFKMFKSQVLKNYANESIVETLFQNPDKMHLTLGCLTLPDDDSKQLAIHTLKNCKETVISPLLGEGGLEIKMSGVAVLNRNPINAKVLYAKVSCPGNEKLLQHLADSVRQSFVDKGLMCGKEKLNLHLTLMNSTFRIRKERKKKPKPPRTFDATDIVKAFEDFDFGCEEIPGIDISYFAKFGENGYYQPLSSIAILQNQTGQEGT